MPVGIIIVHGYTGSIADMDSLSQVLRRSFGPNSVAEISLPFHDGACTPPFDREAFENKIMMQVYAFNHENRSIILIGHSTGGTLVLSCIKKYNFAPTLLVMAGTPRQVHSDHLARWQGFTPALHSPGFTDMARMVSLINKTGKTRFSDKFPVLILAGEDDSLVLPEETSAWADNFPRGHRFVTIPDADHHFKTGGHLHPMVPDIIDRAIDDARNTPASTSLSRLMEVEPEVQPFLSASPWSKTHLSQSPGVMRVTGQDYHFPEFVNAEPVFANVEITTHCQLKCRFCARTKAGITGKHMTLGDFKKILTLLPHAYRITLVGLGEPLLHPEIIDFIKTAKSGKRRVALVTNAMELDRTMAEQLLHAGLDSIAFSLDGHDQAMSATLRNGTNLNLVTENIRQFTSLCRSLDKKISKAVFSALSLASFPSLEKLITLVAGLGVDVLMLSDLNFEGNALQRLWQNMDQSDLRQLNTAVSKAFIQGLPVLSVHGIEEFGLWHRYKDFLAVPASKIYIRSTTHTHCLSPWQTVPVNVEGDITLCDCQPDAIAGNLFCDPFSHIWNGPVFTAHRKGMRSSKPPDACRCCPRF